VRLLIFTELISATRPFRQALESAGFVIDLATDLEVLDYKVRTATYDVVLLDLPRPRDEDLALLQQWRRGRLPTCVLALLGPSCAVPDGIRALEAGADDYLLRPFHGPELLARLRALVRRRYAKKDPILRVHDLEINTAARTVKRAGKSIRLTPREYALLQFLALQGGKLVTRSMIWEHIYNEDDETMSNVVDVYIRYLRNKVDRGFDPPLILTRRGQGYLLCGEERQAGWGEFPPRGGAGRSLAPV
jgi:DNA-binding response OmpR family regulator